jgi:hypothetical protein
VYNTVCPACGYKINEVYNISSEISRLLKKRSKKTVKYLNKISSSITTSIPSENRINYFRFLFALDSINDGVINWGIEEFYQRRHYLSGKGFAYLRKIIQNRNENVGVLKKNERLLLGSTPPVIEFNE